MTFCHSITHARLMGVISRNRDRQSALFGPSRASRSGGFFIVRSALLETSRRKPERETRIPGLAPDRRVSKRAGPVGGNEAQAGYRWQSEPQGVRNSGAAERREKFVCNQVCRTRAAKPTLVVKISDTSHPWKSGFDSRL